MMAPIAGGWLVSNPALGWRWCQWFTLAISSAAYVLAVLFLPETYLPILLDWKARHIQSVTGSQSYTAEHSQTASLKKRLKCILPMPIKFCATEPAVTALGAYLVLVYILLFTFLSGSDYIFKQTYQLSDQMTGYCFGSIAAGSTAFTLCAPVLYSWARRRRAYVSGADVDPEFRLWPAMLTAPLLPVSLFWLGWTNYRSISIWSCLGAWFVVGIVSTVNYVNAYEYINDSYAEHGAVALASITMTRYLIAGGMVMAARPLYAAIGVHWTMTILGCMAGILAPAPWLLWEYGKSLREKSPLAQD
jgi:DHA1 family multidrug resistance protein-like MFS transporter